MLTRNGDSCDGVSLLLDPMGDADLLGADVEGHGYLAPLAVVWRAFDRAALLHGRHVTLVPIEWG